uniref:BTB domain-containing protein n=1 Tax=Plectus sambesii TaxID=2011161 RepID=A0A914W140_9BILA
MDGEHRPRSSANFSSTTSSGFDSPDDDSKSASYVSTCFHVRMGKKIQALFDNDRLCDVTLVCENERVNAHRVVLSAASDYFAAMFTSGLTETKQRVVVIKDVEPKAMRQLVRFCYTGTLDMDSSNVEDLVRGGCLLQLPEVVDACCEFLATQLHPTNCLGIRQFADVQNCPLLHRTANLYAQRHFTDVMATDEFMTLADHDLFQLLCSDELNVTVEETVFEALRAWIHFDLAARRHLAGRLLSAVRLAFVQPEYIVDQIQNDAVFVDDRTAQALIMEALKYRLLPERRTRNRPRKSTVGCVFVVAGGDAHRGSVSIERYDPLLNEWALRPVGEMPGKRLQFGVAVIDQLVYVVGGRDGLKTLSAFDCWDPTTGAWYQMPPMMTPRHGLGVAVLEGPLYACGGHDGWAYLNSVERWDPTTKTWSFVAEMNSARNTAGVAVLNGRLYAVGGRDSSQVLRSVERYNPHTNKWTLVAPMNRRRGSVGVGVLSGFIYAVGGMDAPASNPSSTRFDCVERYDPKLDKWTLIASLSCGRDGVSVCPLGERLLAIGGFDGQNYLDVVEAYDTEEDCWTTVAPLRTGRAGSGVIVLPSSVCAAGRQCAQVEEEAGRICPDGRRSSLSRCSQASATASVSAKPSACAPCSSTL